MYQCVQWEPFKIVTITFTFTARTESPSSLLPDQSHLQVYCQSHLQVYPPFETVIDGRWSIAWSMSLVRAHSKQSLSPSSLLPKSPSSLLPNQSHLQVYCQSHLQVYSPWKLSFMADQVLPDLCLWWEPIWNCSSLLLQFTPQVHL